MPITINASPTNGLVQTADGSGIVKLQSNGVTTNALAWCTFVGSTGAITSAYNISSITRNSAGSYTFNFATATTDANYAFVGLGTAGGANYQIAGSDIAGGTVKTTSSFRTSFGFVSNTTGSLSAQDPAIGYIVIFGN